MIPFFRKTRQQLADENRFLKYARYAIGEIVLVVIGILIALQINNWQQEKKNLKLEKRYLEDLVNDLKQDSVILHNLYLEASKVAEAKNRIYKVLSQPDHPLDSLPSYFNRQWLPYKTFSPSTSTIDEMKSSSHLEIIRDDALRKQIVSIYHKYELFMQDEALYRESTREIFSMAKNGLRNIDKPRPEEIKVMLEDHKMLNAIRKNFAFSRVVSIENISDECHKLLEVLRAISS